MNKPNNIYIGLANLGNTCFLNSCLQVLKHIDEFHTILENKIEKIKCNGLIDCVFTKEYYELNKMMSSNVRGVISPNRFVNILQLIAKDKNELDFTEWNQNDISDILFFMMTCFHKSICRKTNFKINGKIENTMDNLAKQCYTVLQDFYSEEYSEILELFYGIQYTTISSIDGSRQYSIKPEIYMTVDLPIVKNKTIYECLEEYMKNEELKDENAWFNEKTGKKEDITKSIRFWSFPNILIFILKRYTQTGSRKLAHKIDFPFHLDLSKYVSGYNPNSYVYDLFGIGNHSGGLSGGHYTSYVKTHNDVWIHCNDTIVENVNNPDKMISPKAYCLFYRKK
jgi:ubiquitin carboxyl-terminal hydrolase 8